MADESKEEREITYVPLSKVFEGKEGEDFIVTSPGFNEKADVRFRVGLVIPKTDEDAKARFDCTLRDIVAAGVRQFATRVNFKAAGWSKEGVPKGDDSTVSALLQKAADDYKVGAKAAGTGVKVKAQALDTMTAETGLSPEALTLKLKELKAAGLL